jgi:hypothetical protein
MFPPVTDTYSKSVSSVTAFQKATLLNLTLELAHPCTIILKV